jgi:hypothetical protein
MAEDEPYGIELMDAAERRVHALHVSLQHCIAAEETVRQAEEALREANTRRNRRSVALARGLREQGSPGLVTTDEGAIYTLRYACEGAACPVSVTTMAPAMGSPAALVLPVKGLREAIEERRRAYHARERDYHAARAEGAVDEDEIDEGEEEALMSRSAARDGTRRVRATLTQIQALLLCHRGVGFLAYHAAPKAVIEVEFYHGSDGQLYRVADGQPLLPLTLEKDEDD